MSDRQVSWLHPEKRLPVSSKRKQWHEEMLFFGMGVTVAGTAPAFNRIPFYTGTECSCITKSGAKVILYFVSLIDL